MSASNESSNNHPNYLRVFLTFARNSLVRDMMFRTNFLIEAITSVSWALMNLGFYWIVFQHTPSIGADTGWGRYEFFVFMGTSWIINAILQAFLMPNMEEFSEMIRKGGLDFILLKPIDTQFLVSLRRVNWSSLSNLLLGVGLVVLSLRQLTQRSPHPWQLEFHTLVLYVLYVLCGVMILFSLMTCLAASSVWLGRNQTLYDFWFYITNFSRYPMEIYRRGWGLILWAAFTFVVPVLLVVNVPARILAQPIAENDQWTWSLAAFTLVVSAVALMASRWVFQRSLLAYRSASS